MIQEPLSETRRNERTVLVVDDDGDNRYLLSCALRHADFVVHEAVDAHEALRLLRSQISFDVVVTDVQMPGEIDGGLLAETIRVTHPAIVVVVVSGLNLLERLRTHGIAFFQKPYLAEEILDYLNRRINS